MRVPLFKPNVTLNPQDQALPVTSFVIQHTFSLPLTFPNLHTTTNPIQHQHSHQHQHRPRPSKHFDIFNPETSGLCCLINLQLTARCCPTTKPKPLPSVPPPLPSLPCPLLPIGLRSGGIVAQDLAAERVLVASIKKSDPLIFFWCCLFQHLL